MCAGDQVDAIGAGLYRGIKRERKVETASFSTVAQIRYTYGVW